MLSISDGNEIAIPTGESDADADPTNELQTLSYEDGKLSITDGNEIELPTGVADDDPDPTNELQTLSYEDGILSITDGNEIELPIGVADDDPDPTNELQSLRLNGNLLEIVSAGDGDPSVTLPTGGGGTSPWQTSGSDIYYNAGDVGIGTNNPADKLHVVGDTRVVGDLTVRSGNNNRVLLDGSSTGGEVAVYDKDHRKVAFMRSASESNWTDPSGDFGYLELKGPNGNPNVKLGFVGTSSEQDRGGIGLYNEVDNNSWWLSPGPSNDADLGLYYQSGSSFEKVGEYSRTNGMYSALSDRRVKENFSSLANVLTGIRSLNALTYNYIFDKDKRSEIGFIAQEVNQQFPQLVNDMDGYLGVNYSGLSVVAIKAIQEQQEIIDKQQQMIEQLLERVEKLEKDERN
ncbi:MAG: tail fiber domain-containing protein [Saprospiraceae bacterium]|nr:tail fiber domain-containing protein [Saprospiraceae bacterium]